MKRQSKKARQRAAEAKPIRDALRQEVGQCEVCECSPEWPHRDLPPVMSQLDVHEICRGPHRQKALDKRYALLVVCRKCHDGPISSRKQMPEPKQLAILFQSRPWDFDLRAYLELTNPDAPSRISPNEVKHYMSQEPLTITEVAELMKVNRRTAQSWIDDGELVATDVRGAGTRKALWRVNYSDLMDFVAKRKKNAETRGSDE